MLRSQSFNLVAAPVHDRGRVGPDLGKIAAVVLDVGSFLGMGGKHVAVAMNDLKVDFDNNNKPKFSIDMTKDQLKAAQAFDLNEKTATTGSSTAPGTRTVPPPRNETK